MLGEKKTKNIPFNFTNHWAFTTVFKKWYFANLPLDLYFIGFAILSADVYYPIVLHCPLLDIMLKCKALPLNFFKSHTGPTS